VIIAVGIFLPMGPLAGYFKLQALPGAYFPILVVIVLGYMALTQLVKGFYERRSAGSKVTTNWQVFVGQVCRRLALWSYHVGDDNTERTSSHKSSRRSPASTMRRHRTNHRILFDGSRTFRHVESAKAAADDLVRRMFQQRCTLDHCGD